MRAVLARLAMFSLCAGIALGAWAAADTEVGQLLERAEFWQGRARDDLAREALERALRLSPDHPEALLALARLQLRADQDREAAGTLERLRKAHPNHAGVEQLDTLLRIRGPDRDKLRQARQLARAGRVEDALRAYRAIFPNEKIPDDELALEYAQLVAGTRDGWERARIMIAELVRKHPDDPRYRVALASHISTRKPVSAETLKALRELSTHSSVAVSRPAREAWRRAVLAMDAANENLPALREYIEANPGETAVKERLEEMQREIARGPVKTASSDPAARAREQGWAALEAGRLDEAEAHWREALTREPKSGEATAGLGLVRMRQSRHADALELFRRAGELDPAGRAKWDRLANTARYWLLLQQAKLARESGQLDVARAKAEEARAIDPNEANAAMELARVHVAAGRDREAEALLGALGTEQRAQVSAAIDGIRAARLRDQAKELSAQGKAAEAIVALEQAAALDPVDPWLRLDLARAYAARGDAARGRTLFEELLRRSPRDGDARYAYAIFLSGIDRDAEAMAALESVVPADRSPSMTRLQRRLWAAQQGKRAMAYAQADRASESRAIVTTLRAAAASDPDLAIEVARVFDRMGADDDLRAVLDGMGSAGATPERDKAVAELRASLALRSARVQRAAGNPAQAAEVYRGILKANPADRDTRMALIDTLMEMGDFAAARPLVDEEMRTHPQDAQVLGAAARLAQREGKMDEAVRYERAALADGSGDAYRYRRLAEWLDDQSGWHWSALDWLHRSGTRGKSRIDAAEVPLAWKQGWRYDGRWYVRVAPARVAAGQLNHEDAFEVDTFGAMLLCRPSCTAPEQVEDGVTLAAGFERGPWRVDLGSSPIGFPVVNVVGGLAYRGELGPMSYTVEASRRALASSLLSYAGTRDPHTGRIWGGVVASGVRLNISRDSGGDYGAWGLAGLYRLTGRNVQDNDKGELMAGFYRRLVNEEDRIVTAGLTGIFWRFSENVGEYTFGHGGYYSPKRYRSLSLPLTYAVRSERTSVFLRASVSASWSEDARAPFFPTDAALQAQAEALAPTTFRDPFYPGGDNGHSYGRGFAGAVEHQLAPGVFLGGRAEIERSTNYTPNRFLFYVRFALDRVAARPVTMPPESGIPGGTP